MLLFIECGSEPEARKRGIPLLADGRRELVQPKLGEVR